MKQFTSKQFTFKQTLSTLTLAVSIALLTACGGGGSGDNHNNNNGNNNSNNNGNGNQNGNGTKVGELKLNKSFENPDYQLSDNLILIGSYYLNQYQSIQDQLGVLKSQNKQQEFIGLLDKYFSDLLLVTKPVDDMPSYAPRGELKSKLINVVNGKLDYSDYVLKGDFNNDGLIDTDDLEDFKQALYAQDPAQLSKYDINGDGVLDSKDLLELTAQLLTEIAYYDFYSPTGQKLNIPTRKYTEDKVIDYNGSETQILVVAKDINKASSFSDQDSIKLSDDAEVWYKKYKDKKLVPVTSTTAGANNSIKTMSANVAPSNITPMANATPTITGHDESIINAIESIDKTIEESLDLNHPYLVGLEYRLILTSTTGVDAVTNQKTFEDPLNDIGTKIYEHFNTDLGFPLKIEADKNTNFGKPSKMSSTSDIRIYKIGMENDNFIYGGKANSQIVPYMIKDENGKTLKKVIGWLIADVFTTTYISHKEHGFTANVKDLAGGAVKGTFHADRYGPVPEIDDNKKEGNGTFYIPDLAFGGYDFSFENECGCPVPLNPNQKDVTKDNEKVNFNVTKMQKDINVKLNYKDKDGKPIKNKLIHVQETAKCRSKGHVPGGMMRKTDDNGVVNFVGNFTSGEFLIDGKKYNFCENTDKDMTGKKLWDVRVDYDYDLISNVSGVDGEHYEVHKTFTDVEIATVEDKAKSFTANSNATALPPTPFIFNDEGGYRVKYLGMQDEFALVYTMNGQRMVGDDGVTAIIDPKKYCIGVNDILPGTGQCGTTDHSGFNGKMQAYLDDGQVEKLKNHQAFTYTGQGTYGQSLGFGKVNESLVVEFTPK